MTYSNNPAADAILHYYASAAAQVNAAFDAVLLLPETLDFTDADLCILLGNLMENAVEACSRQHTGKRFIILKGKTSSHQLRLVADNSFDGTIHKKTGISIPPKEMASVLASNPYRPWWSAMED